MVNTLDVCARASPAYEDIRLRPRCKSDEVVRRKKSKTVEWTMKNSVFAAYQLDTAKHLQQAFQSDYKRTKIARNVEKIKNEDEKTKVGMRALLLQGSCPRRVLMMNG